jgi:hypothetical protein
MKPLSYEHLGRYIALKSTFRLFDPSNPAITITPDDNFLGLGLVASRAHALLKCREPIQIEGLVQAVDAAINLYFHDEIQDWLALHGLDDPEARASIRLDDVDCPNPTNTSELEALMACADRYSDPEFDAERQHELFAALGLAHIDDAIRLHRSSMSQGDQQPGYCFEATARAVLNATEAIGTAEQVRRYNWLKVQKIGQESRLTAHEAKLAELSEERRRLRKELEEQGASHLSQVLSSNGKKGAEASYAKKKALREWALNRYSETTWISAAAAAKSLKNEIVAQGKKMGAHLSEDNAVRTISEWFREANKSTG